MPCSSLRLDRVNPQRLADKPAGSKTPRGARQQPDRARNVKRRTKPHQDAVTLFTEPCCGRAVNVLYISEHCKRFATFCSLWRRTYTATRPFFKMLVATPLSIPSWTDGICVRMHLCRCKRVRLIQRFCLDGQRGQRMRCRKMKCLTESTTVEISSLHL